MLLLFASGFIFLHFCSKRQMFTFSRTTLTLFDKCHKTSRIFTRTELTFIIARGLGVKLVLMSFLRRPINLWKRTEYLWLSVALCRGADKKFCPRSKTILKFQAKAAQKWSLLYMHAKDQHDKTLASNILNHDQVSSPRKEESFLFRMCWRKKVRRRVPYEMRNSPWPWDLLALNTQKASNYSFLNHRGTRNPSYPIRDSSSKK